MVKAVAVGVVVIVTVGVGGCYWYRYADLMRTHTEVLGEMADKLCTQPRDAVSGGSGSTEYRYPLERAQDFARVAAKRCPGRRSLVAFRRLLGLYAELLERAPVDLPGACAKRGALARHVQRVERRLAAEPRRCG
jgi:hypothetical protein